MDEALATVARDLPWAVALPWGGALVNALLGRRLPRWLIATVACAAMAADFALASRALHVLWTAPAGTVIVSPSWPWLCGQMMQVPVRLMADALSVTLWLIVTGVGFLIHVYSSVYQAHEPGYGRYFAWLNFFVAAMLLLVLADALPVVFVGWEGVGLASWALIGFQTHNLAHVQAGRKAFVVNRIGDAGFLLAMFLLFARFGTLGFAGLYSAIAPVGVASAITGLAAVCLLLAACGKSAQLPLYLWLPDAMAGPTPVSALIHAATMVTAGVYLLCRMGFLLVLHPQAMAAIAVVGACTALLAALSASAQADIKKVLAYSTVSQLGYMFMGVGLGAAPLALFHVTTHAMFKAGLFLCAGSVIHALAGEQDMRKMGQLGRAMPKVAIPATVCALALAGVPPLGDFVSKDALLAHAFAVGRTSSEPLQQVAQLCFWVGLATAFVTAWYMGRWLVHIFASPTSRLPIEVRAHVHDAPLGEAVVLWTLGALAIGIGALNWPSLLGGHESFVAFLRGNGVGLPIGGEMLIEPPALGRGVEALLMAVSVSGAAIGLALAYTLGQRQAVAPTEPFEETAWQIARRQAFGYDQLTRLTVAVPFDLVARDLLRRLERRLTSGLMLAVGHLLRLLGFGLGLFHSGNVQRYMAVFVLALALLLWAWIMPVGQHTLRAALQRGVA